MLSCSVIRCNSAACIGQSVKHNNSVDGRDDRGVVAAHKADERSCGSVGVGAILGDDAGLARLQGLVQVGREAEVHDAHLHVVRDVRLGVGGCVAEFKAGQGQVECVQSNTVRVAEIADHELPDGDDAGEDDAVQHVADFLEVVAVGRRIWSELINFFLVIITLFSLFVKNLRVLSIILKHSRILPSLILESNARPHPPEAFIPQGEIPFYSMGILDDSPAQHIPKGGEALFAREGVLHERGVAPVLDEPADVAHGAVDALDVGERVARAP